MTEQNTEQIVALVDQILSMKQSNPDFGASNLEQEIDRLIYELYGLTSDEIAIVEEATEKTVWIAV